MLIGIPAVSYAMYQIYADATNSTNWPSVDGKVTSSRIEQSRRKFRVYYDPKIEYNFSVKGSGYHGTRISFMLPTDDPSEESAQAVVDKHPVNSTCKVYYDPTNPWNCTLETGTTPVGILICALVPVLLAAVGVKFLRDLYNEQKGKQI
jgi:hypothetical protein